MDIQAQARMHADAILTGRLLAIDPASGGTSSPGFAYFHRAELLHSGTIPLRKDRIQYRLQELFMVLQTYEADVLVIERIRGAHAHEYLHWSVGVSVAALHPRLLFEMPVSTWKKHAGKTHEKSDENDAVAIGQTLIALAEGRYARAG